MYIYSILTLIIGDFQRSEVAEFSGLRSSGSVTYAKYVKDSSFFDVVSAQFTPKVFFLFHLCIWINVYDELSIQIIKATAQLSLFRSNYTRKVLLICICLVI